MTGLAFASPTEPLGRGLVLACRGQRTQAEHAELSRLAEKLGLPELRRAAQLNKVEHLAGYGFEQAGLLSVTDDWFKELDQNEAAKLRTIEQLAFLGRELASRGHSHAVIESAGVALATGLPLRALGSGDFDVLVPSAALPIAIEFLESRGFKTTHRGERVKSARVELELPHSSGRSVWLELCTEAFDRAWVPLPFAAQEARWLARTVPAVAHADVQVLSWADLTAQVAIHTSLHSYVRSPGLRLHADVERLCRAPAQDWPGVVNECSSVGARTRAWVSLCMARDLLGAPVDPAAIQALAPSAQRAAWLVRLIDHAGVLVDGRPKLPRAQALLLEALVDDRAPQTWLRSLLLPSPAWLSARFGLTGDEPLHTLHARRISAVLGRWRPG